MNQIIALHWVIRRCAMRAKKPVKINETKKEVKPSPVDLDDWNVIGDV